jgi:hypothetical protein
VGTVENTLSNREQIAAILMLALGIGANRLV